MTKQSVCSGDCDFHIFGDRVIVWIPVGLTPLIFTKLLKKLAGNDWVCAEREWFLRVPGRPKTNGGAGIGIDSNTTRVVLSSFTLRHSGARLKGVGDNHTPDPNIFQFNSIQFNSYEIQNSISRQVTQIMVVIERSIRVDGMMGHIIKVQGMLIEKSKERAGSRRLREYRGSAASPAHDLAGTIQKR